MQQTDESQREGERGQQEFKKTYSLLAPGLVSLNQKWGKG